MKLVFRVFRFFGGPVRRGRRVGGVNVGPYSFFASSISGQMSLVRNIQMYIIHGLFFDEEEEEDLTTSSVAACYSLSGFLSPCLSHSLSFLAKIRHFRWGGLGGGNQMSNSRDTPLLI